ncbi:ATP-dependent Clp protease adaptor ClpS [archaeon]|nr:ATP-dependent Clp protease adaptor ClpS [archaeon]
MSNILENRKEKLALKPPSMWNVVFINDDFTTFEFVMICLITIFNKSEDEAFKITNKIHIDGKCIVGHYTKDMAQTRQMMAIEFAKSQEYPLQVELEESSL